MNQIVGFFLRGVASLLRPLLRLGPSGRVFDRLYLIAYFVGRHGRWPRNRLVFNDVLHRILVTDEALDPLRVLVSDKELVKLFVKVTVGDEFNVPTIAVLEDMAEVRAFDFPATCCIKPTHASGRVILRKDGEPIDYAEIESWFRLDMYRKKRESNYRYLKHKVIVEPLLFNSTNVEDYKVFCFQGRPKMVKVDFNRKIKHERKFYDVEWNELPFSYNSPPTSLSCQRPPNLQRMLDLAAKLSERFSFIRVDFYTDGESIYVGELTNCTASAGARFIPAGSEYEISKMIFSEE